MTKAKRINESRDVSTNGVQFTFFVDIDPMRSRFIPKTSKDLDKLSTDDGVDGVIKAIESRLQKITGIKWSYDSADPGAGYSFIPDELALAQKIESSF